MPRRGFRTRRTGGESVGTRTLQAAAAARLDAERGRVEHECRGEGALVAAATPHG